MRRIGCNIAVFLCYLFWAGSCFAQTVVLATGEWEPFSGTKLNGGGVSARVVTAAFNAVGYDVEFEFQPWKRNYFRVERGAVLGSFPWSGASLRRAVAYFSEEISPSNQVVFYLKKNFKEAPVLRTVNDLKKYKLGGIDSYWYHGALQQYGIECEYSTEKEVLYTKLKAGRIQLALDNYRVGWEVIRKMFPNDVDAFASAENPLDGGELCVLFSKKYPNSKKIRDIFDQGLHIIKQNGVYSEIVSDIPPSEKK